MDFPKDMQQDDSCSPWNHNDIVTILVPGAPSSMLTHSDTERKHPAIATSLDFFSKDLKISAISFYSY